MPLTDVAIRALKPETKRYSRTDERSLVIEVFPTGGMLWRYRYRVNGKPERVTRQGLGPEVTVAEFGERFSREIVSRDRKDITIPRRYFDKSIVPAIGSKPVREVTTENVRAIIWRKKNEGFDAAAGMIRGVLKRLFDYAMTAGLTAGNPVMALPMRHVHRARSRDRALAPQEIRVFLKAVMDSNVRRQFKVALRLMLARWEHVDFEKAEWSIPAEHSKTGKPHLVFLSPQALGYTIGGVRGVYNRTGYAGQRKEMLGFWGNSGGVGAGGFNGGVRPEADHSQGAQLTRSSEHAAAATLL